ncbi:polyprenol monophosphomannose synthase [bacterium]|nr:polyprenol monophosphomannose synthase [bacterium]
MKHLIVIPTYNESENISLMVESIFNKYPDKFILVVDDSSPDGTGDIVKNLQKKYSNLNLLTLEGKGGLARAYINGFTWGLQNGYDLFTSFDADFSHPIDKIEDAAKYISEGADITIGSRYTNKGITKETNFYKNFISIGGNFYTKMILGHSLDDWTGGFNTYTRPALEKINLESVKAKGYVFQAEMKYKALKAGCNVKEFPIVFEERQKGKSKMCLAIVFEAFFSMIRIRFGM